MEYSNQDILEQIRATRDAKRPEMQDVIDVIDAVFARFSDESDYRQILRGPDTWSWLDATNIHLGFEKWYVLSYSVMDGTEGYPMITIRQSIAPRLDSWVTLSQLIVGPTRQDIETSFAMLIGNHMGAFEGVRESVADMITSLGGNPTGPNTVMTMVGGGGSDNGEMN